MNVSSQEDIKLINDLNRYGSSPENVARMRADLAKIKLKLQKAKTLEDSDEFDFQLRDMSGEDKDKMHEDARQLSMSSSSQKEQKNQAYQSPKSRADRFFLKRTKSIFV